MDKSDEWINKQKWISEMKIDNLKKAIKNIGRPNMQTIHISANDFGMGMALKGGDYIDISEEYDAIETLREVLINILNAEKEHLKLLS